MLLTEEQQLLVEKRDRILKKILFPAGGFPSRRSQKSPGQCLPTPPSPAQTYAQRHIIRSSSN